MHGHVIHSENLTPRMVRIVAGGAGLDGFTPTPFTDQYVNVLFAPAGAPYSVPFDPDAVREHHPEHRPIGRRYTVRAWDEVAHEVTIDFVVHGDAGTAGAWANGAVAGDVVQFEGPTGSYAPDPAADWHLMVGDESATPAIAASVERLPADAHAVVVLLADNVDHHLPLRNEARLDVHRVHRDDDPGNPALLPDAVRSLVFPAGRPQVFVHGEASETRAIRRHLFGERGIDRDGVSISPYWRRDHTDEEWRLVKRDWLAEVAADL